ncbi:MAG: site-specific DNA-methyltransferase [Candidatus Poribacteria bacterium]|nr:site-specific DNA-methyltransferase [Candidatus Poribacteria bacterium]
MARKKRTTRQKEVQDYRHDTATRKNNPPAGIAAQGQIKETPKQEYAYNPHLPPNLRSDPNGDADKLPELLQIAQQRALSAEEAKTLADALRHHNPWLEWAGKQETKSFTVDPVALHIHERVSAKAILKVAERQNVQRELFADPQQDYSKAVDFYQHDVDWANRLILGDSLTVMSSLAHREDLAGKVQMIYIDPPYGIKFASNFQPTVFQRDVKDREQDLTREREQIRAYRDTWTLGVHSYLAYLRDRLIVAKDLLTDSGSIFVQISDENIHRVRCIMDEVFGCENFFSLITFKKTLPLGSSGMAGISDYLIWYAKDKENIKYKELFEEKPIGENTGYTWIEFPDGSRRKMSSDERRDSRLLPLEGRVFFTSALASSGYTATCMYDFEFENRLFKCGKKSWRTHEEGMQRVIAGNRIMASGALPNFIQYHDDFPVQRLHNLWNDTHGAADMKYTVQTSTKVIQRCLLMTTDPGDLVLDPTCGSGTTAYVAESWGRRWITIDTSRVAIALARQRLLTTSFEYYKLKNDQKGIAGGFINKTVSHIMLKSIAQNTALNPIFAKHEPILKKKLNLLNHALAAVTPPIRSKLLAKLVDKENREGKRSIIEADKRRWQLPETAWQEWEVPYDTDPDWPEALQEALTDYRKAWRAKMDEVNACIAASSEGEELVDQSEVDRKRTRVSGPFTVEAVQPPEEPLDVESPIGGEPEEVSDTFDAETDGNNTVNAEAYLDQMIRLLQNDGVQFPNNQTLKFATLDPIEGDILHAEGDWEEAVGATSDHDTPAVAVVFGPQHGPVTAMQVEDCLPIASRRGYTELVFAGFSFDGAAQAIIQEDPNPRVRIHIAHINPDVAMGDLLKETPSTQLFTVFGMPRTTLEEVANGEYIVKMEGVDIYNPVDNTVSSAGADKVAAWFVDSDYDGRTFCITQAFFPDKSAWSKIARALKGVIDEDRFEQFSGTASFPFPAGEHACVAVKVIDPRGNEVMRVHNLGAQRY